MAQPAEDDLEQKAEAITDVLETLPAVQSGDDGEDDDGGDEWWRSLLSELPSKPSPSASPAALPTRPNTEGPLESIKSPSSSSASSDLNRPADAMDGRRGSQRMVQKPKRASDMFQSTVRRSMRRRSRRQSSEGEDDKPKDSADAVAEVLSVLVHSHSNLGTPHTSLPSAMATPRTSSRLEHIAESLVEDGDDEATDASESAASATPIGGDVTLDKLPKPKSRFLKSLRKSVMGRVSRVGARFSPKLSRKTTSAGSSPALSLASSQEASPRPSLATVSKASTTSSPAMLSSPMGKHNDALKLRHQMGGIARHRRSLRASVRDGKLSASSAKQAASFVASQLHVLVKAIKRWGTHKADGSYVCTFGVLYEKTVDSFAAADLEAILATARDKALVVYAGSHLHPVRDAMTAIHLINEDVPEGDDAYTAQQVQRVSVRRRRQLGSGIVRSRLGESVRGGHLSREAALAAAQWVDSQLRKVISVIIKHGIRDKRGYFVTTFSVIFDKTDKIIEASEVGEVLATARTQGLVAYDADHVLKLGGDDLVEVTLLQHSLKKSNENTYTFSDIKRLSVKR
eukprot:TRINITY_DN8817_c0_g1_i1.p1 TRINITY_DN8817_c0_g1~~TRINITY_DN8817_c0_g1_i1.p1  ORF type:complete len:571 (+),score=117.92 TRINITY_DN8817_c0_g1_i1:2-1714(+)